MMLALALSIVALLLAVFLYVSGHTAVVPSGHGPEEPPRIPMTAMQVDPWAAEKRWLVQLFAAAWLVRLAVVVVINSTGAIQKLGLSSDSLHYTRIGKMLAVQMQMGHWDWSEWIDNGWYQFNGLVFYLFGPHPVLIQLFNITVASVVPVIFYFAVKKALKNVQVARWTAVMIAFFPSFIYWSALMLKDPVSWLAVALLAYGTVSLKQRLSLWGLVSILAGLVIFLGVREYMFYISIILVIASMFPLKNASLGLAWRWLAVIMILGFAAQAAGFGFLAIDKIQSSMYFDLDYLNHARVKLSMKGSGRFFDNPEEFVWGKDTWNDIKAAALAAYYSLVSLDLTNIGSVRQLMALPEVLLFLYLLPKLWVGLVGIWRDHRNLALPLLGFGFGILVVYASATTNKGALFRWRMQALPFLLAFIAYGLAMRRQGWFYRFMRKVAG